MRKLKILLVENSITYRQLIVSLGGDKASIVECENLEQAREAITTQDFDVLLLALHLPEGNTIEFCREFNADECHRETVTVFIASDKNLEWRLRAYEAGAEDFIIKNLNAKELVIKLDGLISYHRRHVESIRLLEQKNEELVHESYTIQVDNNAFTHFFRGCARVNDINQFGGHLSNLFEHWGLSYSARIINGVEELYFNNIDDLICPIERNLFIELSESESKVQSFGSRSFFRYGHVSMIVKNMPVDDEASHGRLIDIFHIVADVINNRCEELRYISNIDYINTQLQDLSQRIDSNELKLLADDLNSELIFLCDKGEEESGDDDEITFF